MDWVKTVNDAIEYMEDNLTEKITLADISGSVNLSAFHFQRAFTLLTGMSPAIPHHRIM
ncbi:MAG: AraC family transcriptional regulator [Lachnospiraceae bacterium]|nr:AraC family transcriptional regulator [Lachnospiraceae bacterium]